MRNIALLIITFFISSCSGDGSEPLILSAGLKIFVTTETHGGDYANDPLLTGSTAFEKADDFCNKSSARPNGSTYKALLVDGITRDAISLTDWVLQTNTNYYRPYNNVLIGRTSNIAVFTALFADLDNSICSVATCGTTLVYTGIVDAGSFSTIDAHCESWSNINPTDPADPFAPTVIGKYGRPTAVDDLAFSNPSTAGCNADFALYCVEQP